MHWMIPKRLLRVPVLLVTALVIATCAPTMATSVSTEIKRIVCGLWQPISWADADTDQTIREVKKNNARRKVFCR
jgi:hypothetical protein